MKEINQNDYSTEEVQAISLIKEGKLQKAEFIYRKLLNEGIKNYRRRWPLL